ncbi:hypothetical protein CY35_07G061100 [Sphagnum magellanicum]|jgi:hypothetical protein|uniref:Uncharacterized protein n=1 Tax=Sphagnum magellanicum TaxID=128215 RepID=A0ACB8HL61_9BRYO|nr:hypothetical protein CY35_07G061100 [Sphagnum magellanicum]
MAALVKPNAMTVGQLWRSYSHIRLQLRRETELRDINRTHSYTSLSDVMGATRLLAPVLQGQQSSSSSLMNFQSLQDIHNVHMKNPLVEKAARYYLATGSSHSLHQHGGPSPMLSSGFSSLFRILAFPFHNTQIGFQSLFGGARAWIKQQLYIKN